MIQISLYNSNDRLLKDSDLLIRLKTSTSLFYIPIRFTLFNRIPSLGHCLCSSYSSSSTIIKRETIDQTLSTCSLIPPPPPSSSSYLNENNLNDQSIFDEITSQFGEICSPLPKNHEIVYQKNCFQHSHKIFHLI